MHNIWHGTTSLSNLHRKIWSAKFEFLRITLVTKVYVFILAILILPLSRIREQDTVQGDQPAATSRGGREASAEYRYWCLQRIEPPPASSWLQPPRQSQPLRLDLDTTFRLHCILPFPCHPWQLDLWVLLTLCFYQAYVDKATWVRI